jgi:hypothetical protein
VVKTIQYRDTASPRGQRNICFSQAPELLPGFALNTRFTLEQVVASPLKFELDTPALSAMVSVPALLPGVNLLLPGYASLFSIIACLGVVPDVTYTPKGYSPQDFDMLWPAEAFTPWFITGEGCGPQVMHLQLPPLLPVTGTLVLTAGLRMGKHGAAGEVFQHKYAGAGRILEAKAAT